MIPANWIPPKYRELVYADHLRESDMQAIRMTTKIAVDNPDGSISEPRPLTDAEIEELGVRRVKGVIDTRTGEYHPNQYFED